MNTEAKEMTPNPIEMPFVMRVAVSSLRFGQCGRMKSSKTTRATEFKPVDSELNVKKSWPIIINDFHIYSYRIL